MTEDKANKGGKPSRKMAATVAVGVVTVSCAVTIAAFGQQMGAGSFDPSSFFDDVAGAQTGSTFNAAYNVDTSAQDGKANMQSNEDQQKQETPSLEQVNAADVTAGDGAGSAYLVTDGEAGQSIVTGNGDGTGANADGNVNAPVVIDPNGSGDGNGSGTSPDDKPADGSNGGVNDPAIPDPDPTTPTLPDPFFGDDSPLFDAGSGVTTDPAAGEPTVATDFYDDNDFGNSITPLYCNEVLTKKKLMCAAYYYATINGTTYRLEELGTNFQVVGYRYGEGEVLLGLPETISPDAETLTVNFRVRANEACQWHDASMTFTLYAYKVLLEDYKGGIVDVTSEWSYQYPNYGSGSFDLAALYGALQPGVDEQGLLHQLFRGWSESGEEGTSVGETYTPAEKGLTILKPVPLVEIPETMKVGYTTEFADWPWEEDKQVITLFDGPLTGDVRIPEGIAKIDDGYNPTSLGTLALPSTLTNMGENKDAIVNSVADAFVVAAENPYYASANGLFIESAYDDSGHAYKKATVPSKMGDVLIPSDVAELSFPDENMITSFATEGDEPLITCKNGLLISEVWDDLAEENIVHAQVPGGMTQVSIPADVDQIDVPASNSVEAYVDELPEDGKNINGLTAENGLLILQTEGPLPWLPGEKAIIAIPSKMETVTLPSGVTDIAIPENGAIKRYENGDGDDFVPGDFYAFGGALMHLAEDPWDWTNTVNEVYDVPSSLTTLSIPVEVTSIAPGAIHDDTQLAAYEVEDGNETFSSKNGLLIQTTWEEDMWGDWTKVVAATVPPKMTNVVIPAGVDSLVIPDDNCIQSFTAEEGSSIMVENGMIIEDVDGWDDWEMCPIKVRTITKIPAGMKRVIIPDDVEAIADDAISAENAIEWFEPSENNWAITTSNGMLTNVVWEEDWFGDLNEIVTITKVPSKMTTVTIADNISAIAEGVFDGPNAIEQFVVEGEYSSFSVRDGLLYESVNWGSSYNIIGIPATQETVVIPACIEGDWDVAAIDSVNIPKGNSIKKLQYEGVHKLDWGMETEELITPDFSNLNAGVTVVVPDADFNACYAAWNGMISEYGLTLVSDKGQSSDDFIIVDGSLVSSDGTILMQIMDTNAGVYVVPSGVTSILGGATDSCANVTDVVLPASVSSIKAGALTGASIQRVLFTNAEAPQVESGAAGDSVSLQVAQVSVAAYQTAFDQNAGQVLANDFTLGDEDGFTVLRDSLADSADNQVIVMAAPDDLATFDDSSVAGVTAINANAFAGNTSLRIVNLPESLKTVGMGAFNGCTNLELFCSLSTDAITMQDGALTGCSNVNGMAFNAVSASLDQSTIDVSFNLSNGHGYALYPLGSDSYDSGSFQACGSSYHLSNQGDATLLLGATDDGLGVFGCNNSAAGTVALDSAIARIYDKAFYGTALTCVDISSATPPALMQTGSTLFQFVENTRVDFRISLSGEAAGQEGRYVDAWKDSLSMINRLRDDVSAQNKVRALLGMDTLPLYARTSDGLTLDGNGPILEGICTTLKKDSTLTLPEGITTIGLGDTEHVVNASLPSFTLVMPTTVTSVSASAFRDTYATFVFTGAIAPSIDPTSFAITQWDAPAIKLAGEAAAHADSYIQTWKAAVYKARTGNDYTDAVSAEAENCVRSLLGLSVQAESLSEKALASQALLQSETLAGDALGGVAAEASEPVLPETAFAEAAIGVPSADELPAATEPAEQASGEAAQSKDSLTTPDSPVALDEGKTESPDEEAAMLALASVEDDYTQPLPSATQVTEG